MCRLPGVAAMAGAFTEQLLRVMASFHKCPIIFALSNSTSRAECTAEQCYRATQVSRPLPGWQTSPLEEDDTRPGSLEEA